MCDNAKQRSLKLAASGDLFMVSVHFQALST